MGRKKTTDPQLYRHAHSGPWCVNIDGVRRGQGSSARRWCVALT